ncbi:para-nitrobenzyl esterase [Bradyrhizobium diazoefficiens]|jgi:para-nitrobenzyl esterase|uniref:Carboxylic ester hydrolase n=1 Tax=Bradyrhizobium diazoefficiens TaxID=1355477 RepID=A0A0E3VT21_9BRAD|nr:MULTISPECIES: carboxylesterase family protein [Bradyrhizobium]MBR0865830.1 carboxylesterase family protein [Bradyrhizobium diazoefficiens]MBR0890357.1 carboxylesterase family protein [Bradyrhizobium diazoefficiens]MBR0922130.1 carboxylesterase family protein [Bradyrhizobium diazoefficiens]MDA9389792.1 carboxylesterase [Bradyrhizobium sp. CCBAU 45394]MDA9540055.1 carboxylesterase [Bradyrhizobium sp. CCBAU 21362]
MLTSAVQTTSGPVVGTTQAGMRAFKGVPFATAPRFAKAMPPKAWTEPLRCTGYGAYAPQPGHLDHADEAACLSLNIWTPAEADRPLPVLVFIHGGAFVTGGGADYDGAFLAAHGPAVIVTINYRLGPLGFLQLHRLGLGEANNLAISDSLAALDWVRANIADFGGDPDAITLSGQSAGASMVIALATLPQARGKFIRALALSAPGRNIMSADHADDVARRVLAELELAYDPTAIASLPLPKLFAAVERVSRGLADETEQGTVFGPVLDGIVIPREPRDVFAEGTLRDIPLWLGSCRDEMVMFLKSTPPAAMIRTTERQVRAAVGDAGWQRLLAYYRATARVDEDPYEALLSDAFWHRPMADLARLHAAAGGAVWLSRFDHRPALEPFLSQGPTHGADNACLWAHPPDFIDRPILKRKGGPMTPEDIEVAARFQASVLRFVTSGAPDIAEAWPRFEPAKEPLAIFGQPFHIVPLNEGVRSRLWAELSAQRGAPQAPAARAKIG